MYSRRSRLSGCAPTSQLNGSSAMGNGWNMSVCTRREDERKQYANQVGADGWMLLKALEAAPTPDWMKTLPAITTLRLIWEQQFEHWSRVGTGDWSQPCLRRR